MNMGRGQVLDIAKIGILVVFALYVLQSIFMETANRYGGGDALPPPPPPPSGPNGDKSKHDQKQQNSNGGGGKGKFVFTRTEDTCTEANVHPISAPNDRCNVEGSFRYDMVNFQGSSTGDNLDMFVVVPNNYNPNRPQPYPVVYSLHPAEKESSSGQKSFYQLMRWRLDAAMCTMLQLQSTDFILVYPSGGDKCYVNSMDGKTSMAEDNVVKDVVPYIRQNYNVATKGNLCFGMSMGAYGCLLFGMKYPDLFPNVVVQSPGRYPRFVPWETLIANEGPKQTPFSSRDFLMQYVFDADSYNSYDLCTVAGNVQGSLPNSKFTIFHGDQDPYAEQVDDIIDCMQKKKLDLTSYLVNGCGHGDLPLCMASKSEHTCHINKVEAAMTGQAR